MDRAFRAYKRRHADLSDDECMAKFQAEEAQKEEEEHQQQEQEKEFYLKKQQEEEEKKKKKSEADKKRRALNLKIQNLEQELAETEIAFRESIKNEDEKKLEKSETKIQTLKDLTGDLKATISQATTQLAGKNPLLVSSSTEYIRSKSDEVNKNKIHSKATNNKKQRVNHQFQPVVKENLKSLNLIASLLLECNYYFKFVYQITKPLSKTKGKLKANGKKLNTFMLLGCMENIGNQWYLQIQKYNKVEEEKQQKRMKAVGIPIKFQKDGSPIKEGIMLWDKSRKHTKELDFFKNILIGFYNGKYFSLLSSTSTSSSSS